MAHTVKESNFDVQIIWNRDLMYTNCENRAPKIAFGTAWFYYGWE